MRKLQPIVTTKLENMSIHYDIKSDVRYQQGAQYGKAEGITIGEQKGKAEGLLLTTKIIKLYTRGFAAAAIAEKLAIDLTTVAAAIAEYEAD